MPRKYTISRAVMEQRRAAAKQPKTVTDAVIARLEAARAKRWPSKGVTIAKSAKLSDRIRSMRVTPQP